MKTVDKERLQREATLAKVNSYSPYSKFVLSYYKFINHLLVELTDLHNLALYESIKKSH